MGPFDVGGFTLMAPIGWGSSATVWRATSAVSGAEVAVKVLDPVSSTHIDVLDREVRAVASLDHPSIATLIDFGVVSEEEAVISEGQVMPDSRYLVMELAGRSLAGRRMGLRAVVDVALTVLDALGHAHARGFIHRDVKPSNILIGGVRNRYVLADFGLSLSLQGVPPALPGRHPGLHGPRAVPAGDAGGAGDRSVRPGLFDVGAPHGSSPLRSRPERAGGTDQRAPPSPAGARGSDRARG